MSARPVAPDLTRLARGIAAGERAVIARAITLVESGRADHQKAARRLVQNLLPQTGSAVRVGITGAPGVGKSTTIDALGTYLTGQGHKVAVLAVDPSSTRTGGSILADKTRMARLAADPNAFVRPSPASGTLGGVAAKTRESMLICEAAGYDVVLIETVGVGQSETMVANITDCFVALMIPGAGLTLAEQMGLSDKADRITGVNGIGNSQYQREQDSPFSRLQLLADLSRPPQVKFNDLATAVNTGVVEENPLNFDLRVDFFRQSDERVITAFTVQAENRDLVFQDSGGLQQARMNIFGRITSVAGRRVGIFEDPVITVATPEELSDAKDRKSAYQKAVPLAPGTYKVDVIVRDVSSGATGIKHLGFTVPRYDQQKLSTSTMILAAKLESLSDQPAVGQFVIGTAKVIPNVSGVYHRGQPVGVYLQIYNAGIDQTTLRPSVDVDYVLIKDGKELGKSAEDWRGMSDSGQRLTLARLIDTRALPAGEYEVAIRIRDRVTGQSLSPSQKFSVIQ
jgi:Ni2+-binding GTPase involved in maturation of urease and hydrogenase